MTLAGHFCTFVARLSKLERVHLRQIKLWPSWWLVHISLSFDSVPH